MRWHSVALDVAVHSDGDALLEDGRMAEGLLTSVADAVGPGQSKYDPQVAVMEGPGGGLSGTCLFPGGHVVIHTWLSAGRVPGACRVEVTSSDPIDVALVAALVADRLGVPAHSAELTASGAEWPADGDDD